MNSQPSYLRSPSARRAMAYTLTIALAALIGCLTLSPAITPPQGMFLGMDKIYHILGFSALILPGAVLYPRALFWTIPAALLFGGAIEIIQPSVGRARELADFVADGFGVGGGILLGLWAHLRLRPWFNGREEALEPA